MTQPRISPIWLVLTGILSVQFGAAVAKDIFDLAEPTLIVWLRLTTSAVVFLLIARPDIRGKSRADWLPAIAFGLVLGLMNWSFYQSFARIPLGLAVTIEFVGPLTLAVIGSRRARDFLWIGLAGIGVVLLGFDPTGINLAGTLFALLAGACWAAYILLSGHVGRRWSGIDGLTVASVIASMSLLPLMLPVENGDLTQPAVLLLGALVGLLSSVIPYSVELMALRTMRASVFGILMSLEPAAAALAAFWLLGEVLTAPQWLAMACVIVASVGATRGQATLAEPVPD